MAATYINAGTIAATSAAPTITPDLPASIVAGNYLFAVAGGYRNGATTFTWSAGWTSLGNGQVGSSGVSVAYRIATGSDPVPTLTTNASAYFAAQIFQYSQVLFLGGFALVAADTAAEVVPGYVLQGSSSTGIYLSASYSASGNTTPAGWVQNSRVVSGSVEATAGTKTDPLGASGTSAPSISFSRGIYGGTFQLELVSSPYSVQNIPLITASGYAYSGTVSSGTIPSITASGYMEIPPVIPYITASGTATTGNIGTSTATIPLITATGTAEIQHGGTIAQTMPSFTLDMTGVQQKPLVMENFIVSMTGESGYVALLNVQMAHFTVEMTSDPFGSIDLQMLGFSSALTGVAGSIGTQAGTTEYFTSVMTGYLQVTGSMAVTIRSFFVSMAADTGVGTNYATVSMHTEWQAITQYTNYPFNSFAQFNNLFMGASSTGLYVLSGANDNGVNIDAIARTGITDMGTSHLKKNEYVYVGYRATGDLKLRINTNDSHVRDYMIRYNGETGLHVKRVKLGKGVIARYWQLEIQNLDGADFDLNTLEIKPTVLSRRVASGRA